jgi:hypothetical protein
MMLDKKGTTMKVFLGSSSEAAKRDVLSNLAYWLEDLGHSPVRWDDPGVFLPGQDLIARLREIAEEVDAAILVFSEDDQVWYRQAQVSQPRDNVLLEYGLFAGITGPSRVIVGRDGHPKNPADLGGLVHLDLAPERQAFARVQLRRWLDSLAMRPSSKAAAAPTALSPEEEIALEEVLTDPRAGDRGAWTYPVHQRITTKGLTAPQATLALNGLVQKGYLEAVEVDSIDSLTGKPSKAPAFRVTAKGLVAATSRADPGNS